MWKISSFIISVLIIVLFCAKSSLQIPQYLQEQKEHSIEKGHSIDMSKFQNALDSSRQKRSSNDLVDQAEQDLDELLMPSLPMTVSLESLPPLIRYLVEQKLKEQRSRMTPRLGRDLDDDIECQRPRPPFAPRLGKKSVPFKPRLGRQVYDDIRC